jgi:hypothetical protein
VLAGHCPQLVEDGVEFQVLKVALLLRQLGIASSQRETELGFSKPLD